MRGLPPSLIVTGQHDALDPSEFGLGGFAAQRLECPGQEDPHRHVRAVTAGVLPHLASAPDLLVVQGDTSSALGCALAGFTAGIPVAQVEAGLRTHDLQLPWPEEEYRMAIDAGAELLFAPTARAASNLVSERVSGEIHVTGNTGIDAVFATEAQLPPPRVRERAQPLVLVTCHRRETWRDGLIAIADAVARIASGANVQFVLHPNRHVSSRMRTLLGHAPNVRLLNPMNHRDLLGLIRDADLVMSDSGGIQEEAPALGVPLLVLREKTERPEGIECGNARLAGTCADRIVAEARRLLDDPLARAAMARRSFPYGDGRAAPRIATIILDWLNRKDGSVAAAGMSPEHPAHW
jgi:UDP-N-acetylglucosamine 2-epimerase (non-hydrolysing)